MSDEPKTIDEIRSELRGALFMLSFGVACREVECDPKGAAEVNDTIAKFALFGASTRLLSVAEANAWLEVAKGKRTGFSVAQEYDPEPADNPNPGA